MIQATTFRRARLPLALIAALLVLAMALTANAAMRLNVGLSSPRSITVVDRPTAPHVAQTRAATDTSSCDHGAYVTGDMAGDASPAAIYNTLCGTR